jgi:hypothetical protein
MHVNSPMFWGEYKFICPLWTNYWQCILMLSTFMCNESASPCLFLLVPSRSIYLGSPRDIHKNLMAALLIIAKTGPSQMPFQSRINYAYPHSGTWYSHENKQSTTASNNGWILVKMLTQKTQTQKGT